MQRQVCIFVFLTSLKFLLNVQTVAHKVALDANIFEHCLMELKIPELLRLQHSLMKIEENESHLLSEKANKKNDVEGVDAKRCEGPKAMALVADERNYAPPSYNDHHQPWQPDEKPSKLQTLFQISITSLAFLSFGGYLLCLIVQAIKSKGTTYFHPVATATTTNGNGGVKRIKIYRRSRRWLTALNSDYPMTSAYSAYINYTDSTSDDFNKSHQL